MVSIPRTLENALLDQYVVPFVGAGVSRSVERVAGGAMFPTWMELLMEAAERLESDGKLPEASVVRGLLTKRSPDYLAAASHAREGMGSGWFPFLRTRIDRPRRELRDGSLALPRAIWKLPSRLVVTTNYDQVLRFALDDHAGDMIQINVDATAELSGMMRGRVERPTVWHLHGHIQDTQRLILTPDGYNELYPSKDVDASYAAALAALRYLLAARTFLFIGFSLDDEKFGAQIEWVDRAFAGAVGPHYMLVRARDLDGARRRLDKVGCIELLPFDDHGEPLVRMIETLAAAGRTNRATAEVMAPVTFAPQPENEPLALVQRAQTPKETLVEVGGDNNAGPGATAPAAEDDELTSAAVRRSYRLVYQYQRRVFDRLAELTDALAAMGLAFERWDPALYSRPAKSTTEFFRRPYWAWDLLPAYHLRLVFSASVAEDRSARRIVVSVVADDGFRARSSRDEPDPRFFAPAEQSRTELRVDMMRVTDPQMSLNEAWVLYRSYAGALVDGYDHEIAVGGGACAFRAFRVDMDVVLAPAGIEGALVSPIREWFER
ncbi:SIR2 family NAD-dependent protein deacylase [Nannocystis radixulma]|uniref:SIR2 family protein n=1 Tax=Nannocystis radixulma TaxID=2995305 RepID=A0ABT5BBC6_9BACT|nr:SIR2 family protein [Nannocystis radixulma]MDC0670342.1 SIR2 family protein [Nannocystis radixulma]